MEDLSKETLIARISRLEDLLKNLYANVEHQTDYLQDQIDQVSDDVYYLGQRVDNNG